MLPIPALANLIANYPKGAPDVVAKLIGGTVDAHFSDPDFKAYKNTCAIRVSRSLNYSGDPIPAAGGGLSNPFMADHKIRTDKGGDKKRYIFSTYDMRAYLTGRYGTPKSFSGRATQADLAGVKGIIGFAFFHVDVWDGTKCAGHDEGFGNPKVVGHEILVWEAP